MDQKYAFCRGLKSIFEYVVRQSQENSSKNSASMHPKNPLKTVHSQVYCDLACTNPDLVHNLGFNLEFSLICKSDNLQLLPWRAILPDLHIKISLLVYVNVGWFSYAK